MATEFQDSLLEDITISNEWLNHIKKRLGYPSVNTIVLTDNEIKDLIVRQALYEYFTRFPQIEEVTNARSVKVIENG